ncbi:DUF4239 domain-containing protein [Patescibacteria group bacterium]|nr:DUF4239 domain-containing protein [Patescibacteria group bacterium]
MISSLKKLKIPYLVTIVIITIFLLVFLLPVEEHAQEGISAILGIVGLLFAILVGFFITDLWSRFQRIRENVAVEVSGLQTYYLFVQILGRSSQHKKWAKKQQELIDRYVREFFYVEWNDYGKIDPYFNEIIQSLGEVGELKTNRETETYTNLLPLLNEITTARQRLFMYGKDRLSKMEWMVVLFLSAILIFSIFSIRTTELSSLLLSGTLISTVTILLLILRDLNDLSFGEDMVSFEPYETIFDVIGKPRFYLKRDIEAGRVKPPRGKKYRAGD